MTTLTKFAFIAAKGGLDAVDGAFMAPVPLTDEAIKQFPFARLNGSWYEIGPVDDVINGLKNRITALQADLAKASAPVMTTTNDEYASGYDAGREVGYSAGLKKGRTEGQLKLDAYIAQTQHSVVIARSQAPVDKTSNQLLNELYHDRARLERLAKEAASLIGDAHELILANQRGEDISDAIDEDYLLGQLIAYVDNNGDQS